MTGSGRNSTIISIINKNIKVTRPCEIPQYLQFRCMICILDNDIVMVVDTDSHVDINPLISFVCLFVFPKVKKTRFLHNSLLPVNVVTVSTVAKM